MAAQESARSERQVLASSPGTWTLDQMYRAVEQAGTEVTHRCDGERVVHGRNDVRWKRRVRGALQTMARQGKARRVGDGLWVIDGDPARPRRAVLLLPSPSGEGFELRLAQAHELLSDFDGDVDLVLADPPYGLGVGADDGTDTGRRVYGRDHSNVVGGYQDVPPERYRDFTVEWVRAAAQALRPGGQLAVITGAQQSAWVQVAAESSGLEYVNSISVGKVFPLFTRRRFAHAHWRVTVMCRGGLRRRDRTFNCPPDLPKARSGNDYPQDFWPVGSVGRRDARVGQLRYPNSLPVPLVDRLVGAYTRPVSAGARDLVCDPFVGSGTTAAVAAARGLRFVGSDVNPAALGLTAARVSAQLLHERQPMPDTAPVPPTRTTPTGTATGTRSW